MPLVVGEFDVICVAQQFHDGSHLAAQEAMCRQIRGEGYDIQQAGWCCALLITNPVNISFRQA